MIRKILTTYAIRLEEYLSRFYDQPEGLATVGQIGNSTEEKPNKMVVCLLNVEGKPREALRLPCSGLKKGMHGCSLPCC